MLSPQILAAVVFVTICVSNVASESGCVGAEVKATVRSAVDSTVSLHTTVIADLEVKCKNGAPGSYPLYAEYNGKVFAAARSDESRSKYQVSITDESTAFKSSDVTIRIFDEEGYQLFRKASADAKPVATLNHSIRYPYSGPSINSELFVVVFGAAAVYLAYGVRSRM